MQKHAFIASLFLIVGCAAEQPEVTVASNDDIDFAENPIIGGEEDQGDPSIVALYAREPGAEGGSLCTAEIISPTVVLTAAHCVFPDLVGKNAEFAVLTAWNLTDPENPSPRLAVKEVHYHPDFSVAKLLGGNDIAVAILAEPTDLKPIKINRDPAKSAAMEDKDVRIVGYGLNKHFGKKGAGTKRQATVNLDKIDSKFVVTGEWGTGICSGDSGGPVLAVIDGEEQIIGVNSFGFIKCFGNSRSTRVDSYLDFVDQYL